MAQFNATDNPDFVADPNGRLVPRDSVDPADIVERAPSATPTPTASNTSGAATYNREAVDAIQNKLSTIQGKMLELANSSKNLSRASVDASLGSQAAASGALGAARSGAPDTRDATVSRAVSGQGAAETASNRAAASGRATETYNDQRFKVAAYKAAGDLGLNQAALEVKVDSLNMDATTDYLNNLFANQRLEKDINQQQAERIMNYVRDMALIDQQYYSLDLQDQNALQNRIMDRYSIDEHLRAGVRQIESQGTTPTDILFGAAQAGGQAYARYGGSSKPSTQTPIYDVNSSITQGLAGPDASGGAGGYQGGR